MSEIGQLRAWCEQSIPFLCMLPDYIDLSLIQVQSVSKPQY